MNNHAIVVALRRYLNRPVPEAGDVVLMPTPMDYAELIAAGLINRAISATPEANHAAAIIVDMLGRANEYDVAHMEE